MRLARDGLLTIPLFHGTSSLFLDSILEYGLGGKNPVEELGVLPFLKTAFAICEEALADQEEWQVDRGYVGQILRQEVPLSGFNFRSGHPYLSPVELTAVRYALSNRWGSEALTTAARLHERIRKDVPGKLGEFAWSQPLLKVLSQPGRPILVCVEGVEIRSLEGEGSRSTEDTIAHMEGCWQHDRNQFTILTQQDNFRLMAPVLAARLKVFDIEVERADPVSPRYHKEQIWPPQARA